MRFMITDNGGHSASQWAETSTFAISDLIQVRAGSESRQAEIASRVQMEIRPKLYDIFLKHHDEVQKAEQAATAGIKTVEQAAEHVAKMLEPLDRVVPLMDEVHAVLAATPFKAHFAQDHVKVVMQNIVAQHTADVMHLERRYHADRLNQGA